VELVLLGIGAVSEHTLASAASLHCDDGIVIDEPLRSSDPGILALGDCCSFPEPGSGRRLRLESVRNANDQACAACAMLLGTPQPHRALPWFWSEQGSLRLQMTGLMPEGGTRHRRPGAASFSMLHDAREQLACVESVNQPLDTWPRASCWRPVARRRRRRPANRQCR
jgi:3-phenylpropionate/trans-cinnamate dioxygenase ferredoxin reductase component